MPPLPGGDDLCGIAVAMDISFNHELRQNRIGGAQNPSQGGEWANPAPPLLDWQGLAARLSATYALRRSLATRDVLGDVASGSFNDEAASVLATFGTPSAPQQQEVEMLPLRDGRKPLGHQPRGIDQSPCSREVNPVGLADGKGVSGNHAAIAGDNASGDRGLK